MLLDRSPIVRGCMGTVSRKAPDWGGHHVPKGGSGSAGGLQRTEEPVGVPVGEERASVVGWPFVLLTSVVPPPWFQVHFFFLN